MDLELKTTLQCNGSPIHSLFLWNDKNRAYTKLKESEDATKLATNLFIMKDRQGNPVLYTIIKNKLEIKILPTSNVSYHNNVIYYKKGKEWYGLTDMQEIFLGQITKIRIHSLFKKTVFLFFDSQNKTIAFLHPNGEIKKISNPFNEYFFTSFSEKIFIKNKDGYYDCYDMDSCNILTDKDFITSNNITYEKDVNDNLYLWSKQKQSWKQFSSEFRVFFSSGLIVDLKIPQNKNFVILYKIEDDLEIRLIAEGEMKISVKGIQIGDLFFYFKNNMTLNLENPKQISPGIFTRLKKLFSKKMRT